VFSQPSIERLFADKFVTVRLYEDSVPQGVTQVPDAESAQAFAEKLGNRARPYYVVLRVKGKTLTKIAYYTKGLIDSPEEFADFLNKALATAK
jgi:thioredoxin-related protein